MNTLVAPPGLATDSAKLGGHTVTLAPVWTPGHSYKAGQVVAYKTYLLRCTWDHQVPMHADEPWYQAAPDQELRPRLRRWVVAYDEMKAAAPGDTAA